MRWVVVLGVVLAVVPSATAKPKKCKEVLHAVAAFESTLEAEKIDSFHVTATLQSAGTERPGKVLHVETEAGADWSEVEITNVPSDIRKMRSLRFWLKGDADPTHELWIRIYDKNKKALSYQVDDSPKWMLHDVRLAGMRTPPTFKPDEVEKICFLWFDPAKKYVIELDDLSFVESEGGWRYSDDEMSAHIFGEKRVKKVIIKKTKHFTVWMDTKAAAKKFPKALEGTYKRIRKMLSLDDMKHPLPVFIFQNPNGYWDFCERHLGWSRAGAEASAGHGSGSYFATYFQGNKTPVVTHELTHSMVHRVLGWGGGSWFQEGTAVYCEELDDGKSAARTFSPSLRGGRFVPLRKFVTLDRLIDSEDKRGGAETSHSLYAQAGAFFEFLLRSASIRAKVEVPKAVDGEPYLGERIKQLADLDEEGDAVVAAVEKIYGMSIEDLEKAWIAWGSKPPKPRK